MNLVSDLTNDVPREGGHIRRKQAQVLTQVANRSWWVHLPLESLENLGLHVDYIILSEEPATELDHAVQLHHGRIVELDGELKSSHCRQLVCLAYEKMPQIDETVFVSKADWMLFVTNSLGTRYARQFCRRKYWMR